MNRVSLTCGTISSSPMYIYQCLKREKDRRGETGGEGSEEGEKSGSKRDRMGQKKCLKKQWLRSSQNQSQEAQQIVCEMNTKQTTPRHILVKLMENNDKDKIFKKSRLKDTLGSGE